MRQHDRNKTASGDRRVEARGHGYQRADGRHGDRQTLMAVLASHRAWLYAADIDVGPALVAGIETRGRPQRGGLSLARGQAGDRGHVGNSDANEQQSRNEPERHNRIISYACSKALARRGYHEG